MLQNAGVLYILTCKCASPHSGVPFLNLLFSKSGPKVWCFAHFDLPMCFSPQRRAIFNFKNGSEIVLFATAACNFSTSELQKMFRECGVLCILTCKCASRHSGMPFFRIATSKMAPTLRCFEHFALQMCFPPQRRAIFHLSAEQLPPHPPL